MANRKRIAVYLASLGAMALVGLGSVGVAQLRACDEASDVRRGALKYRLCGISREPIATMPLAGAVTEPLFAWRLADGNKSAWHSLKYETSEPNDATTTLTSHLREAGFSPRPEEARSGLTWWTDGRTELGFAVRPLGGGHALVEVFHDGGLE